MKLKGKVAIVTGGAQGIGKAISKRLADDGASVVIFDMKETGAETAKEIGPQALFLKTDCTKKSEVETNVAMAIEKFEKIDILVNN
ncbi:MAG: SDR family NAD(P)-dependent oxidoreductase, partial [Deltaproteobacteria bacterium]|nr:SDR family NAD(P)-dependent oxidoreductase [Deltaproteobacteria bacterium]